MISLLETPDESQRRRARAFGSLCVFLVVVLLAVNATAGEGSVMSEAPNVGVGLGLTLLFAALAAMVALGMPLFVIIGVLAILCFMLLGEDYRGYDTMGETTVIFTAGVGVLLLLVAAILLGGLAVSFGAGLVAARLTAKAAADIIADVRQALAKV